MDSDIINQAILESTPAVEAPSPIETPKEEIKATEETTPTETPEPEDVPFPKKAVNALSRRDKQIGKLQAQLAAERAELAKYREQQPKDSQVPSEESFDNYGEYLKAKNRAEFEQEQSEKTKQTQQQQDSQFQERWVQERTQFTLQKADEAMASVPDFQSVIDEYRDVGAEFPPYLENAFLELDNAPMAFYALAKEGKLESLLTMSPARAIMEIGRAEVRGEALSKAKPVTKTPPPIEGLKGTGSSTKSLDTMNHDQLMAWVDGKQENNNGTDY